MEGELDEDEDAAAAAAAADTDDSISSPATWARHPLTP